ncbi:hypothetical protein NMY22_g16936 [Coprinellus aureogranulatus]|nr:hypothetical protein NMY22_g16936 [Coprinellus aureogranulatus]
MSRRQKQAQHLLRASSNTQLVPDCGWTVPQPSPVIRRSSYRWVTVTAAMISAFSTPSQKSYFSSSWALLATANPFPYQNSLRRSLICCEHGTPGNWPAVAVPPDKISARTGTTGKTPCSHRLRPSMNSHVAQRIHLQFAWVCAVSTTLPGIGF